MRYLPRIPSVLLVLAALVGCTGEPEAPPPEAADPGARFVRFALALEAATGRQYDIDYWGPEEVQAEAAALGLSVEAVADSLEVLQASIDVASASGLEAERLEALAYRIGALRAWIDVLQGAEPGFEEEARRILGVRPRRFPVEELDPFVAALEEAFPGPGPLAPRVGARMAGLAVPEDRREAVFRRPSRPVASGPGSTLSFPKPKRSRSSSPTRFRPPRATSIGRTTGASCSSTRPR
jgi:hypothetical protein